MANHSARRRARTQPEPTATAPKVDLPTVAAPTARPVVKKVPLPERDFSAEDSRAAGRFALATFAGAAVALASLFILRLTPFELWSPFGLTGTRVTIDLVLSGIAGGLASALFVEGTAPVQAAGSCALGWGVFGLLQHTAARGLYLDILNSALHGSASTPSRAVDDFFANAIYHQAPILAGLLAAAAVAWATKRVLGKFSDMMPAEAVETTTFRMARAITFPFALIILGSLMLWVLGWIPIYRVPDTFKTMPPVHISHAVLVNLICILSFGTPAYTLRARARALGTVGYLLAGPLATAIMAFIIVHVNRELMKPVAALLWSSSPLELASFSTFGAIAGYWLRDVNTVNE